MSDMARGKARQSPRTQIKKTEIDKYEKNTCRINPGSSAFILKEFHSKKRNTITFHRIKDYFPAVTKDKASEENGL